MIDLKNTSANMMLVDTVLSTFCIMDDKLKSGHLGLFLSLIELVFLPTNCYGGKLLPRQENHRAEIGGLESYQLFTFGEQKAICPFSIFFLLPIELEGEKTKGDNALLTGSEEQGHDQADRFEMNKYVGLFV